MITQEQWRQLCDVIDKSTEPDDKKVEMRRWVNHQCWDDPTADKLQQTVDALANDRYQLECVVDQHAHLRSAAKLFLAALEGVDLNKLQNPMAEPLYRSQWNMRDRDSGATIEMFSVDRSDGPKVVRFSIRDFNGGMRADVDRGIAVDTLQRFLTYLREEKTR